MKKIACVGYHGTGAGVVDDLFREFDNVYHGTYEAEVRLLHDPDGISDLQYHLVDNPHRLSSSLVIKRFLRYCKAQNVQARKVFGDGWLQLAEEYAKSLVVAEYYGYTNFDLSFISKSKKIKLLLLKACNKLKPPKYRKAGWYNYLPELKTYYSLLTEEDFIVKTKVFVEKLCTLANKDNMEYVMLDQFISASNPSRCMKYVDDIKTIIVDRDPRDLYINQVLCGSHVLPKEPKEYCTMYRSIRRRFGETCLDSVLYVNFEDMIYKYDEYVKKVIDFIGLDKSHHCNKRHYFNPDDSGSRTQLWKKYPEFLDSIRIIENELPDYLYQFPESVEFKVVDEKANKHHLTGRG